MNRALSSSSSDEIYWERKQRRSRGGIEPGENDKRSTFDSDVEKYRAGSVKPKKYSPPRHREQYMPQDVYNYYHIKKMPKKESVSKEKVKRKESKKENGKHKESITFQDEQSKEKRKPIKPRKSKDEPPFYPEYDPKKPDEYIYEKSNVFNGDFLIYIILGYITGIFLVLFWYFIYFETAGDDLNLKWFLIVLLVLFILVLCYSHSTRCVGALFVPLFLGSRGRMLFMALAFYLALTGPVMNIIRNIEIMIHSLACGQGLLMNALTPMHQIMGEPVYIVEESVQNCLSQVRKLTEHLDDLFLRLEAHIVGLYSSYKSCGDWLRHQQKFFDNQMGTPYDRCIGAGSVSVQECHAKFSAEKSVCNIEKRFDWFCSNLKDMASFYDPYTQQQEEDTEQMFQRPLESFDKIRSIFEVSITFDHVQKSAEDNESSINDIDLEIGKQLDLEMNKFMFISIWLDTVVYILIIIVFLEAMYFRINYLGSENYRNIYLTKEFYAYNTQQNTNLGYSALPLRFTEMFKYVNLFSLHYLPVEVDLIFNSIVFMFITSLQLFTICFVDLSLFWMLAIVSYHSHQTAEVEPPQYTKILVEGGGTIGYILRGFVKAFEPLSKNLFMDIQHCLPLPGPPKYLRYWEIMMICVLSWLLLFFEPHNLRLCHKIMSHFYPDNERRRAEYLHERILRDREIFILTARRKARVLNEYVYDNWLLRSAKRLNAFLYRISRGYMGAYKGLKCIICQVKLIESDCVQCETPKCRGVYCQTCFIESNCHCILCNDPTIYGDYTTYSEAEDSSDESDGKPFRPHHFYCGPATNERHKKS